MKFIVIFLSFLSYSLTQSSSYSIYGGLNYANINKTLISQNQMGYSLPIEQSSIPSFQFGIHKNMGSYILGLGISGREAKYEYGLITSTHSYTYLDLHALLPYSLGPGFIWAGFDIGINLSAKIKMKVKMESEYQDLPDSNIEDVGVDYGIVLGYTYPLSKSFNIFTSYYLGLGEAYEDGPSHIGIGLETYEGGLSFTGIALGINYIL